MTDCIFVLNAGSSSIKFALYDASDQALIYRGLIDGIGAKPTLKVRDAAGAVVADSSPDEIGHDRAAAAREVVRVIRALLDGRRTIAVGHRVVHGGELYATPVRIDAEVVKNLERFIPLAPLHQPHNLAAIRALLEHAPHLPQVACFDTAFHRGHSTVVAEFAIPREFLAEGVRRYGFHGLSYEYITGEMRRLAPDLVAGRMIVAHLGNGASMCAIREGRSISSTMGFTAADGLVMGTRCGSIDPGLLIYLMDHYHLDARGLEDLIYRKSGLLGVSGISSDMRTLRESDAPEAREAIDHFVYRIVRSVGSLAAELGGIDGIVFTAGIGEHDAATRAEVSAGCSWLGLTLDPQRNRDGPGRLSTDESRIQAWMVPTDEERMIARHTAALLGEDAPDVAELAIQID